MSDKRKVTLQEAIRLEYKKCIEDPVHFMKTYVKIQHPLRGTIPFLLYEFQEKTLREFCDNNFNIVLKSRQMGISTLVSAYSLWLMVFHSDKNILVISTKQDVAKELVSKVRFANDNLPSWLKVECIEDNRLSLKLKNGSRILATSSASDTGRSFALSLLILDEAAFIEGANEIWTSAYPTLSTGGRAIILSTPNGVGSFFHRMWKDAEAKRNNFNTIKLPWYLHPERDKFWREEQDKIAKSPKEAAQELDCEFLTSGNTVVDLKILEWYDKNTKKDPIEMRGVDRSLWIWKYPDYTKTYIVSADVARGDGSDFSAFHVLEAESLDQCAEYKAQIDPKSYGRLLYNIATEYNKALLIVENNTVGFGTLQEIIDNGYSNTFYSTVDLKYVELQSQLVTRFYSEDKKRVPGFSTTLKTRPLIIAKMESYVREKSVNIYSTRTLAELQTFIWDKGKAVAMDGYNDDLCLSLCIGLWVRDTAIRLKTESQEYSKLMVNNIGKAEYTGSAPVYTNRISSMGYESWNIRVGKGDSRENILWLL